MVGSTHTIRIQTKGWIRFPTAANLEALVKQLNHQARDRRMLGQIDTPCDGRTYLSRASHVVHPTARVRGSWILVEIETVDTAQGRTVAAFFSSGISVQGRLRGVMGDFSDAKIFGIDIDLDLTGNFTVLDSIVDALDAEDDAAAQE